MIYIQECSDHPTAEEAAQLFLRLVVSLHGIPEKIITDQGTQFESQLWHELVQQLGSRVAIATTHHPQSNGLTERANRTLLSMLRKVCLGESESWVRRLPLLELAYNSSVHSTIKVSPFMANYGYLPKLPTSFLAAPALAPNTPTVTAFCRKVQEATQRIWAQVRMETQKARESMERRENRN